MLLQFSRNRIIFIRHVKTFVADLKKGDYIRAGSQNSVLQVDSVDSIQKGRAARSYLINCKSIPPIGPNSPPPGLTSLKPSPKDAFDTLETVDQHGCYLYTQDSIVFMMVDNDDVTMVPGGMFTPELLKLVESGERIRIRRTVDTNEVIGAFLPGQTIKVTVKQTTNQGSSLVAVTESGGRVVCPSMVTVGDKLTIDAFTGQYLSRMPSGLL